VVSAFFAIRDRDSVLGRYSVGPSGDTTLSSYGVDRVVGGQPVFSRVLHVTGTFTGARATTGVTAGA